MKLTSPTEDPLPAVEQPIPGHPPRTPPHQSDRRVCSVLVDLRAGPRSVFLGPTRPRRISLELRALELRSLVVRESEPLRCAAENPKESMQAGPRGTSSDVVCVCARGSGVGDSTIDMAQAGSRPGVEGRRSQGRKGLASENCCC